MVRAFGVAGLAGLLVVVSAGCDVQGNVKLRLDTIKASFSPQVNTEAINARLVEMNVVVAKYVDRYGEFPANLHDPDGRPLLSWRAELLPFLGHKAIYDQLRLDEPWDSPHNFALLSQVDPRQFAAHTETPDGHSDMLAVVGYQGLGFLPDTSHDSPVRIKDVTDGLSETVLLVHVAPERGVTWAKPADYWWDTEAPVAGLGAPHRDEFSVVYMSGVTWSVPKSVSTDVLYGLFGRSEGIRISW